MKRIATLLLALILAACTTVPLRNQLAGFADAIAYQADRTDKLYSAGVMGRADAEARLTQIEQARALAVAARLALVRCEIANKPDCLEAVSGAAQVRLILQQIDDYLTLKEARK